MTRLLILIFVPEIEPYVAHLRERFDPAARRGLGAHVTLLHASLAPEQIDQALIARMEAVASVTAPFGFQVTRVARFPGTLYLTVEIAAAFVVLHERLVAALPAAAADKESRRRFVPHISIVRKSAADDREVETELGLLLNRRGPISCACSEIVYLESISGAWRPVRAFALNGGTDSPSPALS